MKLDTIGKKIAFGFGCVTFALVISGLAAFWQSIELSDVSHRIREVRVPTIAASMTVLNGLNQSQSALKSWILMHQDEFRSQRQEVWRQDIDPSLEQLSLLSKEWVVQEDIDNFNFVNLKLSEFRNLQNSIERMPANQRIEASAILDRELRPIATAIRQRLEAMIDHKNRQMDEDLKAQAGLILRLNIFQTGLVISGILASLLIGILLTRAIVGPISKAIEVADRIARGDYEKRTELSGSREINRLGQSLEQMRANLKRQAWLSQAQIKFYEGIRSVSGLRNLADTVISTIAQTIHAEVGAFYLAENHKLKSIGGFAFPKEREPGMEFNFGEGLAGQAAAERRLLKVSGLKDTGLSLTTAAGEVRMNEALALPLIYKEDVMGVIELASSENVPDHVLEYLKVAAETTAISLSATQKSEQVKNLLHETQAQAEELQTQQEELRTANEELQTRQEELESTNEELEEQKSLLESQKTILDQKNVELEVAQQALAKRAQELDEVSRYKSEFLANMSHELRTPLNSQLLLSKILEENREGNLTPKQVEFAKTIYSTGMDLLRLINDILDLSKVEAGKLDLDIQTVSIKSVVEEVERDFSRMIEEKGLKFRIDLSPGLPDTIRTDGHRLGQVLRNFLSNAVKFTARGEIVFRVARPSNSDSRTIAFSVCDTGIGIPEDKKAAVFHAFEQVDSSIGRKFGGTGLGLAISKNLATLLKGEIQLDTQFGKGSTFTLVIPESFDDAPHPKSTAPKLVAEHKPAVKPKIQENTMLIVEDDEAFAQVLSDMAKEKGFNCLIARDGAEGLELAHAHRPSCILLDYKLPGLDGLRVLKELKNDPATRHIPVHMISIDDHSQEAQKLGAVGYLVKPADPTQIRQVIERMEQEAKKKIRRVLVIDDDPIQLDQIILLIGNGQVQSIGVTTAHEAYELLQKNEIFDCIVLDLKLPDMTGFQLLEKIHENPPKFVPPVIIYTAQDLSRDEEERLRKYSDSIIIKGARSSDRLLDEVSLFLHRIVRDLPREKQRILTDLYNPEKVFQNKEVLLVDDDIRNVFALASALEGKGLKVSVARNGQEALEALENKPGINLVLMDVMMPVMDGYEAMRRIRKSEKFGRVPIIALTAKAMKGDREMCLAVGASDYLAKPVEMDRLLTLMRVWLSN